jgi:serine/threonine-protein kinase
MGSPLYMSPEQMRSSKDVDARTDLWALGVILFQLLTGTTPFVGESITELAVKVATESPPPVRSFRPDVPPGLEGVITKCLEKDRRSRYANVAELAVALLMFGPKRARVLVERISGILQAAGLSASALALPPSPQLQAGTLLAPETVAPVGRTATGPRARTTWVVGAGLVGGVALVVLVGAVSWLKRENVPSEDPQAHAEQSATPATSIVLAAATSPVAAAAKAMDDVPVVLTPAIVPAAALPLAEPEAGATLARVRPVNGPAPTAPPAISASAKSVAAAPCKLVKTLDKNGEAHFSCPCGSCQ